MFYIQVIVSFIVGGLVIALQTILAERAPLHWRGTVLTIPSTMALGFFFVGLTKTINDVSEVALVFPAALMVDYVFVLGFAYFSRYSLLYAVFCSYIMWALAAYFLLNFPPKSFFTSTFLYALPVICILYFLIKKLPQITEIKPVPVTALRLLVRSLIGGTIIALVVILSKTLGNVWGGLFSAFPAAFSATFLIYYKVHGKETIPSVAKSIFFPGSLIFILYAFVTRIVFPSFGIWWGTLLSYVAVFIFIVLLFKLKTIKVKKIETSKI